MSAYNQRDPMLPHGSDKCRCTVCDLYFNSTHGFDAHRIGRYGVDRQCRTPEEMRAGGWSINRTGHWITRTRDAETETRDDPLP